MMWYWPENTNIDRGEPENTNIDRGEAEVNIGIFYGQYHMISNASIVNNCFII